MTAIPELGQLVSDPLDTAEYSAEFFRLFSLEIMPHESVFRDASGLFSGLILDQVQDFYRSFDHQVLNNADHIGHELAFMARLCNIEEEGPGQEKLFSGQGAFLAKHVLSWIPALSLAIGMLDSPFYNELGRLTLAVIDDHLIDLNVILPHANQTTDPIPASSMDDSSIREIVDYLISPANSGIYLGRTLIKEIGRRHQLPLGFGNRHQMLLNLFRSAGQFESSRVLITELLKATRNWSFGYRDLSKDFPKLSSWIKSWELKTLRTEALLMNMLKITQ